MFQSGIWMAGMVGGAIRTAASEYTSEYVPGPYGGNPDASLNRIFRIYKAEVDAMKAGLSTAEFDLNNDGVAETISIPTKDYREWPADLGAPFIDVDGDGAYDYTVDYPDILGDQFHWYVMTDEGSHANLWATPALNVEVQTSIFGFDRPPTDALGNTMFVRCVIINRGTETIDSMFVSIWHDDDVGDANDDFVACDTVLSIGMTFNDGRDATYGVGAPVSGSDFFQGPIVDAPGDSATILTWDPGHTGVDGEGNPISGYYKRKIYDKRLLPMTSFVKYIRGDDDYGDPETAEEAYRYMNGRKGSDGTMYTNPETGEPGFFVASGDPVTGTGWLDSDRHPSGDRRFLMSSGPFTMAPGDTQEVVGSLMVAGGPDALTSILVFKYFDKFAQNAFDSNFDLCSPPTPKVALSQLDEKIVLSWEASADEVENYTCLGYQFQGYNIYQGESVVGPWHLIKTYDIIDEVQVITDETLDTDTGLLLTKPVQYGSDAGLVHYIEIDQDAIRNTKLINNRKYYFAVTAYAYDPTTAPVTIESPFKPIKAVPGAPGVGSVLASDFNDVLTTVNSSGIADATFLPTVVDPYLLTNHDYEITFSELNDTTYVWHLVDKTEGDTLYTDMPDFPVSVEYYEELTQGGAVVPEGVYQNIEVVDGFILTTENATFAAPTTYASAEATVDVDTSTHIVFGGINPGSSDGTWAGFIEGIPVNPPSGRPGKEDLQLDLAFRFNATGSIATYYNAQLTITDTVWLPFEVWTVEDSTQINLAVYQVSGTKPFLVADSNGVYSFTWNVFFMPIYEAYDPTVTYDYADDADKMGWMLKFNKDLTQFEAGDVFRVRFNNPIFPGLDVYRFTGSGLQESAESLKDQMDKIMVFPNPYFGHNWEENNPLDRKVFFTQLGVGTTIIRIFTLSGDLVAKIEKEITSENDADRRAEWDLRNSAGIPVASGMYLAHVELKDFAGKTLGEKILKLAVFQPEERLDIY